MAKSEPLLIHDLSESYVKSHKLPYLLHNLSYTHTTQTHLFPNMSISLQSCMTTDTQVCTGNLAIHLRSDMYHRAAEQHLLEDTSETENLQLSRLFYTEKVLGEKQLGKKIT